MNQQSKGPKLAKALVAIGVVTVFGSAYAAEYRTHFATAGTLGENIFSSDIKPGSFVGIGYKQASIDTLADGSGNKITSLPGGIPLAFKNEASVKYLYAGLTSQEKYAGGNITASVVLPFTSSDKLVAAGPFPKYGVTTAQSLPNSSANFKNKLDDIEVGTSWDYKKSENTKYSVGLALTTKTGDYHVEGNGSSVGPGYYTLKPSFASITQDGALSYAYKAALGLNTNNSVGNYRTGNMMSLEAAVGYKTSVGAFGLKVHALRQYQDDTGGGVTANSPNPWVATSGVSKPQADGQRTSYNTATIYYTVPVKSIESLFYVGLSTMNSPSYTQVPNTGFFEMRLTKAFN